MTKNIIFVSHTFVGGPFKVGSHHLAEQLSRSNYKVLHISTPLTIAHLLKKDNITQDRIKIAKKIVKLKKNLYQYIPFSPWIPWKLSRIFYKLLKYNFETLLISKDIKKVISKVYGNESIDVAIIDQPTMVGIEKYIKAKKIIYRATDVYKEIMEDNLIIDAEKKIINSSHGLIGTSETVSNHLKSLNDKLPIITLENGVELDKFLAPNKKPKEYESLVEPLLIYVGAFDKRFDFEKVKLIAKEREHINIVLIGPYPESENNFSNLKELNNIIVLGPKKYEEIPSYLQSANLAILPLSDHPSNEGRSPMKIYEYLASGLPVICRYNKGLEDRALKDVSYYHSNEELLKEIDKALEQVKDNKKNTFDFKKVSWEYNSKELIKFINSL